MWLLPFLRPAYAKQLEKARVRVHERLLWSWQHDGDMTGAPDPIFFAFNCEGYQDWAAKLELALQTERDNNKRLSNQVLSLVDKVSGVSEEGRRELRELEQTNALNEKRVLELEVNVQQKSMLIASLQQDMADNKLKASEETNSLNARNEAQQQQLTALQTRYTTD